jgi:FkbM family methyltransferase
VGLLVTVRGNVVTVDSCSFAVGHPAIRTSLKSLLLLDSYEKSERQILRTYLDRTRPVIELGASIGVVACITNRMLDDPGKHVAVEGNPDLIGVLTDNRSRNRCGFSVLNRAVAYGADEVTFYQAPEFLASSVQLKTDHPVTVPAITLGQIIQEYGFERCTVICDIEGGEMDLVKHEIDALRRHVETLILEVHGWRVGQGLAEEMIRTLERTGFEAVHKQGEIRVFRNTALGSPPRVSLTQPSAAGDRLQHAASHS